MKNLIYLSIGVLLMSTSCTEQKEEVTTEANKEIKKEVKAEIINGETTVTITTTEDGQVTTEVLTGIEAEAYMDKDPMEDTEIPEGAEVYIKKMNNEVSVDIDIESILNDPALIDVDQATKEKIRTAIENSMQKMDVEVNVDEKGEDPTIKTKVIVKETK